MDVLQIYYATEEFGTDSIQTADGYFYLGRVFLEMENMNKCDSLMRQVMGESIVY